MRSPTWRRWPIVMSRQLLALLTVSSVLLAVMLNYRFKIKRIEIFYVLLFVALAVNLLLPPEALLLDNPALRYLVASLRLQSGLSLARAAVIALLVAAGLYGVFEWSFQVALPPLTGKLVEGDSPLSVSQRLLLPYSAST